MPYYHRRICPICGKQNLLKLSNHLSQNHGLSSEERRPFLQRAAFSLPTVPLVHSVQDAYPIALPVELPELSMSQLLLPTPRPSLTPWMDTQPYPEFQFQHPFSMMVVGPSQSGKTCFVQQLLTSHRIAYPEKKPIKVYWFYNQWQPIYDEIQRQLKTKIVFT